MDPSQNPAGGSYRGQQPDTRRTQSRGPHPGGRRTPQGGPGPAGRRAPYGDGNGPRRGGGQKTVKHGTLSLIALIVLLVQAVCEIIFVVCLIRLNVLPMKYLIAVIFALLVVLAIPGLLTCFRRRRASAVRLIIGIICSLLIAAMTVSGTSYVRVTDHTIRNVTTGSDKEFTRVSAIVGVYVMKDDPAQTFDDAKDYEFGTLASMDLKNTEKAIATIEKKVGQEIKTSGKDSVELLADSLYNGDVQAILLNRSYADMLSGISAYSDFNDRTRLLKDVKVLETVKQDPEAVQQNAGSADASAGQSNQSGSSDQSGNDNGSSGDGNGSGTTVSTSKGGSSGSTSGTSKGTTKTTVTTGSRKNADNVTNNTFAVYLSGSDTHSAILDTSCSDVNIILLVDPVAKQMLMLNTPRDYFIANPAGKGAKDKLTLCGLQGIDNSIAALSKLYGLNINYSAQINFNGFKKMIDALGGVTVNSDADFSIDGYSFHKGTNELNGARALAFCRERKSFSDGDETRGRHQMMVIQAIIQKMSSREGLLLNYVDIMNSLQGMFVTNLSSEEVSGIIKMQLNDMASWNIRTYAVSGSDAMSTTWTAPNSEQYVMVPDQQTVKKAKSLIKKMQKGQLITESDVAS